MQIPFKTKVLKAEFFKRTKNKYRDIFTPFASFDAGRISIWTNLKLGEFKMILMKDTCHCKVPTLKFFPTFSMLNWAKRKKVKFFPGVSNALFLLVD